MDTNSISQLAQAAPVAQNALNAWHLVALGTGAYLAHAYHSIKAAGGIKNILRGLWDGGAISNAEGRMQNEETGRENPDARTAFRDGEQIIAGEPFAAGLGNPSYIVNRKSPAPAEQALGAPAPRPSTLDPERL